MATEISRLKKRKKGKTEPASLSYRKYGDLDKADIIDLTSITYKGTGYSQATTALGTWVNVLQRNGDASNGDNVMHQGQIYKITGQSTADAVKF